MNGNPRPVSPLGVMFAMTTALVLGLVVVTLLG